MSWSDEGERLRTLLTQEKVMGCVLPHISAVRLVSVGRDQLAVDILVSDEDSYPDYKLKWRRAICVPNDGDQTISHVVETDIYELVEELEEVP